MLGKVWVIVAHCNHNSGVDRQRIPWTNVLDVRTDYGRRGEGFVDCREYSTWDRQFGFSGSVPVLVVHAGAVSVLEYVHRKSPSGNLVVRRTGLTDRRCRGCRLSWQKTSVRSLRSQLIVNTTEQTLYPNSRDTRRLYCSSSVRMILILATFEFISLPTMRLGPRTLHEVAPTIGCSVGFYGFG